MAILDDDDKYNKQVNNTNQNNDAKGRASNFSRSSDNISKDDIYSKIHQAQDDEFDDSRVVNNRRASSQDDFDTSMVNNRRGKGEDFDTSRVVNTRGKQAQTNYEEEQPTPNVRSGRNNYSEQPTPNLREQDKQFIDMVNQSLQNQQARKTIFNMNDFDFNNVDLDALAKQNQQMQQNMNIPPMPQGGNMPNVPPMPQGKPNVPPMPGAQPQQASVPPVPPHMLKQQQEEVAQRSRPKAEQEEVSASKDYTAPDIDFDAPDANMQHVQTDANIVESDLLEEIPEDLPVEESQAQPQQAQQAQAEPTLDELYATPQQQEEPAEQPAQESEPEPAVTYIPENMQNDVLALVDISLNKNIIALLAAQNAGSVAGVLDTVAEDLVVAKVKRSKKLWILLLAILIAIVVLFACCYDSWFGKNPNEEKASGLVLNIVPSEGESGSIDAQYIYYPGSTIYFQDSVRIGSEKYRYVEQPDGSLRQYENTAFSFRFKLYIEFVDEGEEGNRDARTDVIQHVIEPEDVDIKILLDPDDAGNEAEESLYAYDGEWFYYFGVIIPGEKYTPFMDGFSLYDKINNEYQGRKFVVVLEYETVVPNNDITGVLEEIPDSPTSWASYIVSEYQAYYA